MVEVQEFDPFIARTFSSLFGSVSGGEQNFRKILKSIRDVPGYCCNDLKSWVFFVELLKGSLGKGVFGKKIVDFGNSEFYGDHIKAAIFQTILNYIEINHFGLRIEINI